MTNRVDAQRNDVLRCLLILTLPWVAVVKGLLMCMPAALLSAVPVAVMGLLKLPSDYYYILYNVARAQTIGPNLKCVGLLLLPFLLLLEVPLLAVGMLLWGFLQGLSYPATATFSNDGFFLFSGLLQPLELIWLDIPKWWRRVGHETKREAN